MDKILDYKANLDLLMLQWKNSENLVGIINAAMDQGNKLEDAVFEIRDLMSLENGEGDTLDWIGKVWNESRVGRTDTVYRTALQLKKVSYYSGDPESIIEVLKGTYAASYVKYTPEYPGKYRVRTDVVLNNEEIAKISAAGVFGFAAGRLIDALGDAILDANENNIIQVNTTDLSTYNVATSDGLQVVTSEGETLINEYTQ